MFQVSVQSPEQTRKPAKITGNQQKFEMIMSKEARVLSRQDPGIEHKADALCSM